VLAVSARRDATPFVAHELTCTQCGAPMRVKDGKFRSFYGCSRWPGCDGAIGMHADGTPLGTQADKGTRQLRIAAHAAFDQLWRSGRITRKEAYRWMCNRLKLSEDEGHIGKLNAEQCVQLVEHCERFATTNQPAKRTRLTPPAPRNLRRGGKGA
jgi:ssDNA-binding Zn-finger/Zn-ribbon topoisomerase 1